MIKQLMDHLDYGVFAEVALLIFATVFVAIVIRTLATRSETLEYQSRIVLDENTETRS